VVRDRLRELTGVGIEELAGGHVEGEIPLTDAVVTGLARRYLPASAPMSDLQIEAQDGDVVTIQAGLRGSRLLPQVRVVARIEQQPDLPQSPVLGLRWSVPGLGPLTMFAGPLLSLFKALPPGIDADGDRIAVDIAHLLRSRGLGDLLPQLTRLRVTTRQGAIVIGFSLRA
jgi:hypothetical protein